MGHGRGDGAVRLGRVWRGAFDQSDVLGDYAGSSCQRGSVRRREGQTRDIQENVRLLRVDVVRVEYEPRPDAQSTIPAAGPVLDSRVVTDGA